MTAEPPPDSAAARLELSAAIILQEAQAWIHTVLDARLPRESQSPEVLHAAMRHAVLGGGKRLRPALVREACRVCQGTDAECEPCAAALEMIHAYSLVHDDLPCMDNDALRHGKPSCHAAFGEAMAVLAGDGLLTLAFRQLAELPRREMLPALLTELGDSAGAPGMVGGQVLDMIASDAEKLPPAYAVEPPFTVETVVAIHRRKTGALFRAAIVGGALCAGASETQVEQLREFAAAVGQAFQIVDDVLDETSTAEKMGKPTQKDAAMRKYSYPRVAGGVEAARRDAQTWLAQGLAALEPFGDAGEPLRLLARFVVERDH
ncbi:MAG: polyprenyl synthetase family protein [Planctomycetota bacterium]